MSVHVGEAGAANAGTYMTQAQAVLANYPQLDAFALQLEEALPSTNVDAEKVLCFDDTQAILDRRALFIAQAGGDTAAGLAAFEAQPWSPRRQAFEDLWQDGRRFVYCAPNPGTLGAERYGDYCLIVDAATLAQDDTAVFPSDTAQTYTDDMAIVDATRAYQEVGGWPARSEVALAHHGDRALGLSQEERAELVCGALTYMEVVTVGPLALNQLAMLRVSKDLWEEHDELWWQWKDDLLTDPTDLAKAKAYDALLAWEDRGMDIIEYDGP
ncbi:hypothetical protein MKUB_45900 [Mycobacterium kubicae]|uniref:Uncharacterized protein n=1 Tax=Mycobacterium kubicae TaxID=120959 RepID=A0AAX1J8V5_9MYCO|nr:hypothetical protein [Mycobacterium kubicae]MCV7097367.1 hypothetical protein [Mycobacterium kubicae]ORW00432.1 hypothetical protein AWC13_09170 [Mycobacterium kubicae]QNI13358.1 hypothetical protein GAN18_21225 [Mycobacterium kubicae]QPI36880.1 hypothetical protein I2456_20895 [Mycobacterium kubicae]GFG67100.1 hypothetical protein MKUB_45900 [Mycobacterium kubicae]